MLWQGHPIAAFATTTNLKAAHHFQPIVSHRKRQSMRSVLAPLVQLVVLVLVAGPACEALDNGLALTPPMGWLAWERYVCETDCIKYPKDCVNADLFEEMGRRLVEDGYLQLGYQYVNIDDCWSRRQRNPATGQLEPDPARFPQGIRGLADRIHSMGLKLGLYGDCGTRTCQGFPGQLRESHSLAGNYYELDARQFAQWGVDSFKFDGCYLKVELAEHLCPPMGDALNATNRPMLFSCSWPCYEFYSNATVDWQLASQKCNLWRAYGDIDDSWDSVLSMVDWFAERQALALRYHGPGHWFDPDMLIIGNFGLSLNQERSQMALWCIWSAPLYMSNDLSALTAESKSILLNKWAIQVNQDKWGIFGQRVLDRRGEQQVFAKPVQPLDSHSCPSYAIVYFFRRNLGGTRILSFKLADIISQLHARLNQLDKWRKAWQHCPQRTNVTFDVHDLFQENARIISGLPLSEAQLELKVNPSGVRMVKLVQAH